MAFYLKIIARNKMGRNNESATQSKGSFERHTLAAKLAGADVKVYGSESTQLDIDMPEDLPEYNRRVEDKEIEFLIPFLPDLTA